MAGRIEFGKEYYAATPKGLVRTGGLLPVTIRGVVKHWEGHGYFVDEEGERTSQSTRIKVTAKTKYLFDLSDEHTARKAVFKLKLTSEEE